MTGVVTVWWRDRADDWFTLLFFVGFGVGEAGAGEIVGKFFVVVADGAVRVFAESFWVASGAIGVFMGLVQDKAGFCMIE